MQVQVDEFSHYSLDTADCRLQIADCGFGECRVWIADLKGNCRLQIADCRLQIADLQIAD
jgi:hypothetical protein